MRVKRFDLTQDHIELLQHMYVGWCSDEFGAPEIDPKRPYGNSDVIRDIADILHIEPNEFMDSEPVFTPEQEEYMENLHRETQIALQIVLSNLGGVPGTFECEKYSIDWKRAEP